MFLFLVIAFLFTDGRSDPDSIRSVDNIVTTSICNTTDQSQEAICYATSHPEIYRSAGAVLRMQRNGQEHCSAFLTGHEGHILTNFHCIRDAAHVEGVNFEAYAETSTCDLRCQDPMDCPGRIISTHPVHFIYSGGSVQNDFTLVQLHPLDQNKFRSLVYYQLRCSGPVLNEPIYLPQHPQGWGKRIAMISGKEQARIVSLNTSNFNECGERQVAYVVDTQSGSSGSPVVGVQDHAVVALHHCGGCARYANTGINVQNIIMALRSYLPSSAMTC